MQACIEVDALCMPFTMRIYKMPFSAVSTTQFTCRQYMTLTSDCNFLSDCDNGSSEPGTERTWGVSRMTQGRMHFTVNVRLRVIGESSRAACQIFRQLCRERAS